MNILKKNFLFNKKSNKNEVFCHGEVDYYKEISKIVKEARIEQNLSIKELSLKSKIPEQTINSIENNNKNIRPEYPFLRSILIKLEECLVLKKNTLVKLSIREQETFRKEKTDFVINKFDLINTWQGSLLYFFILVLTVFFYKEVLYFGYKCYRDSKY